MDLQAENGSPPVGPLTPRILALFLAEHVAVVGDRAVQPRRHPWPGHDGEPDGVPDEQGDV